MSAVILAAALVTGPVVFADDEKNIIKDTTAEGPAPAALDFAEQMNAANKEKAAGNFEAALNHYTAALSVADTPELKGEAVFARSKILLENKKDVEAEALLNEFLLDESLSPAVRRKTLVTLSGLIKWKRPDEANQYLDQAEGIPAADSSDLAQTGWTRGWIYKIKGQPDNAMEVWLPLLELRGAHPAHLSSISSDIAGIYRQNNDDENARKYFQLAVDYGKKVQYKFDYSAAEKALEKMK